MVSPKKNKKPAQGNGLLVSCVSEEEAVRRTRLPVAILSQASGQNPVDRPFLLARHLHISYHGSDIRLCPPWHGYNRSQVFGLHTDLVAKKTKKPASKMQASQTRFSLGEALHRPQSVYRPVLVADSATSMLAHFRQSAMPPLGIWHNFSQILAKVLDGWPYMRTCSTGTSSPATAFEQVGPLLPL